MNFQEDIDIKEFLKVVKQLKEALIEKGGVPENPFDQVVYESMDTLEKELKGKDSLLNLDKAHLKVVLPNLALVLMFIRELTEEPTQ